MHQDHLFGYTLRAAKITGKPLTAETFKQVLWFPKPMPDDGETTLVLAGDLGTSTTVFGLQFEDGKEYSWVEDVASRFKDVVVVFGNHDHWNDHFTTLAPKCKAIVEKLGLTNVHVLEKDTWVSPDGVTFIGATLWTDMKGEDPLVVKDATLIMRADFTYQRSPWTPKLWVSENRKAFQYIKQVVERTDAPIVVVTHFTPTHQAAQGRYRGDSANDYYHNRYEEFILDNPQIKY